MHVPRLTTHSGGCYQLSVRRHGGPARGALPQQQRRRYCRRGGVFALRARRVCRLAARGGAAALLSQQRTNNIKKLRAASRRCLPRYFGFQHAAMQFVSMLQKAHNVGSRVREACSFSQPHGSLYVLQTILTLHVWLRAVCAGVCGFSLSMVRVSVYEIRKFSVTAHLGSRSPGAARVFPILCQRRDAPAPPAGSRVSQKGRARR